MCDKLLRLFLVPVLFLQVAHTVANESASGDADPSSGVEVGSGDDGATSASLVWVPLTILGVILLITSAGACLSRSHMLHR